MSPAKINLYLEVLEKTPNGYHNIESLMTFCDFGDIISIKKAKETKQLKQNNALFSRADMWCVVPFFNIYFDDYFNELGC